MPGFGNGYSDAEIGSVVNFVTGLGTAAYAAHNVVLNIESLSFLPGLGYATAASALVGD